MLECKNSMEVKSQNNTILKVCSLFAVCDVERARSLLLETKDIEEKQKTFAVACAEYWLDVFVAMQNMQNLYEKAQSLLNKWNTFAQSFVDLQQKKHGFICTQTLNAIQKGVFTQALKDFCTLLQEQDPNIKANILRKIGFCYKQLGDFANALDSLLQANALVQGQDAGIMAELADCHALCGDEKNAKVLFREAFYMDAQKVCLDALQSQLICQLVQKVRQMKIKDSCLLEWLPVYGAVFGVFNIKRVLRAAEVGSLKQRVFTLENELKNPENNEDILKPRLINAYFRLIDYYADVEGGNEKIAELTLKIKILDAGIFSIYAK